jgi:hypothetical protein
MNTSEEGVQVLKGELRQIGVRIAASFLGGDIHVCDAAVELVAWAVWLRFPWVVGA